MSRAETVELVERWHCASHADGETLKTSCVLCALDANALRHQDRGVTPTVMAPSVVSGFSRTPFSRTSRRKTAGIVELLAWRARRLART